MIARGFLIATMLATAPVAASTPAAWSAQERSARTRCAVASGLGGATVSPPAIFSDTAGIDILRVRGRLTQRRAKGRTVTMLCLFVRRTGMVEVQEAPSGW